MYAIFAWTAVRSFPLIFSKTDDRNRMILAGFWTAAAAYITQLMFGLSVTGNTFLLWVCIGALLAPAATSTELKAPQWGLAAAALLLVLAGGGLVYQFVLMGADYQYLLASADNSLTSSQRTAKAQEAVRLNPFNDMYRSEVGMRYRIELSEIAEAAIQAQQAGQPVAQYSAPMQEKFDSAVTALKDTIAFVPDEYDNYVFIASVYNMGGALINPKYYDDAVFWAKKGMAVEPFGPAVVGEYARALIGKGQSDAAITQLLRGWSMDTGNVDLARLAADQYRQTGRMPEAIALLKKAQALIPDDATIAQQLQQYEASVSPTASAPATP
jgi:tetratricopeptide (TPR) repeat protein